MNQACEPRSYGDGKIVCVCNEAYCDDLEPVKKSENITLYESAKSGLRFSPSSLAFKQDIPEENSYFKFSTSIEIDSTKKFQTLLGFGGAFTDAVGVNLRSLPPKLGKRIILDYYSENGLEYSLGRIPIGGTDFSLDKYTYADEPDDFLLEKFKIAREDFEYKVKFMNQY